MTYEIDLGGGRLAIVDDADRELVCGRKWRAVKSGNTHYVVSGNRAERVLLHRLVLGVDGPVIVDHKNGDGLDNTRANLRLCSAKENMRNRNKWAGCSSPFKGVCREADRFGWRVEIRSDGMRLRLGSYNSEHRAARAYDRAARLVFGAFARTNEDLGLYEKHPDRKTDRPGHRRGKTIRAIAA